MLRLGVARRLVEQHGELRHRRRARPRSTRCPAGASGGDDASRTAVGPRHREPCPRPAAAPGSRGRPSVSSSQASSVRRLATRSCACTRQRDRWSAACLQRRHGPTVDPGSRRRSVRRPSQHALGSCAMSTHIGAEPGQIAPRVLLPGDPLRAKWIAETFLDDAECYSTVRNMLGFTGTYRGERVSVQGSRHGPAVVLDLRQRADPRVRRPAARSASARAARSPRTLAAARHRDRDQVHRPTRR